MYRWFEHSMILILLLLTYLLTPRNTFLLEKLTSSQLVKNLPHFMEPEGSWPYSNVPATCTYPEPPRSSPYPQIPLPEDPSYYYPSIYVWVFKVVSLSQVSPPKPSISLSSKRATCPGHLILLDFITRKVLSEYRSSGSSLCPWCVFIYKKTGNFAL